MVLAAHCQHFAVFTSYSSFEFYSTRLQHIRLYVILIGSVSIMTGHWMRRALKETWVTNLTSSLRERGLLRKALLPFLQLISFFSALIFYDSGGERMSLEIRREPEKIENISFERLLFHFRFMCRGMEVWMEMKWYSKGWKLSARYRSTIQSWDQVNE